LWGSNGWETSGIKEEVELDLRKMKDNIRLALSSAGSMTGDELSDYIRDNIDSDAKIITIYLTVRMMHKEGLLVKTGRKYDIKGGSSKLL